MKPETFVILIPGFAKSEADSTCLPSQQSFVKLLKQKYPALNIIVLAFQYPFSTTAYDWHGCRIIPFGGRGRSKLYRLLLWRRVWKKLKQINSVNNITGLLSFWCGECALVGHRFGKKNNIRHHCWIMGQDAKEKNKYVGRIDPSPNELVAISDFIQMEFERNYGIKSQWVIPTGIDPEEFPKENVTRDIDVLGAGSLISLKQYDIFVEVISKLKQQLPGINAMLCGKGSEENKLKKMIAAQGLNANLILTGEIAHPELLLQMRKSRIFLHTSTYEGFGVVCIEALYAGASVISFCKPMNQSISNWHVVQTSEEMIQKAIDILNDKDGEHNPVLPYSMNESVEKIMQLFGK